MIKGFSLIEVFIALAISLGTLTLVIAAVSGTTRTSVKVVSYQDKMAAIFHTMEVLRSDLTKCGMRLHEASNIVAYPLFVNTGFSFRVTYGTAGESLLEPAQTGDTAIYINRNDFFSKRKKILLVDQESNRYEFHYISGKKGDQLFLRDALLFDYPKSCRVIVLKEVEYKLYSQENSRSLKRKVNHGYFQPLLEEITDFNVHFYPEANAVFYKIEINHREQIRGYIYMSNMVKVVK